MSYSNFDGNVSEGWLTDREFYMLACRYADCKSISVAVKWWRAFNEVFVHELHNRGSCRMPNVGTLGLRYVKASKQTQRTKDGKVNCYKVPERFVPIFEPHDTFINDANYHGVTKAFRKRLKAGALTQRDYDRELRRQLEEGEDKTTPMTDEELEQTRADFVKALKKKRNELKGKVTQDEEE